MEGHLKKDDLLVGESDKRYRVEQFITNKGEYEIYVVHSEGCRHVLFFDRTGRRPDDYETMITKGAPSCYFQWPDDFVFSHSTSGYICKYIPKGYATLTDLLKCKINPSFEIILKVCENLCLRMKEMHDQGYVLTAEYDYLFDPEKGDVIVTGWYKLKNDGKNILVIANPRFSAPEVIKGGLTTKNSDLYVLAINLFYLLMLSHPLEGEQEAKQKCLDYETTQKLYGSNPVFIFDPNNDSNRPVKGHQDNADVFWKIYPESLKRLFVRCFTVGIHNKEKRPSEDEWIIALKKARETITICQICKAEVFMESIDECSCWRCGNTIKKTMLDFSTLIRESVNSTDMVDRIGGITGSHINIVGDLWNHSDIEPVEKYDESEPLKTIIKEYSNSIDNIKVMKALLMDFYPNNKLLRNLLMTCVEESILAKLLIKKPVDNMEIYRCEKIIIDSHGCSLDMAKWVIDICIKATNADLSQNEQSKSIESCYDCNLFPKENFEKFFIPVSELDLNSRLYRWLDIMKCFTVRSSVQYDLEFYEKRNNIGDRIINDFCSKLASRGIRIPKNRYEEKIYYYPDEIKNIRICQDEGWEYEYYGMMMLYNLEGLRVYKEYPLDEYTVKHDLKNKSRGTERAFFNLLDEYFDLLCRLYDSPSKCEWDRALGENKSGKPENIEYVVSSLTNNIESLIHWQKKIEFIKSNDYNNSDMIKLLMNLERAFNDDMIIYQRKLLNDVNKVKSYRKHSANPEMSDDPMSLRIDFQFKIMNECETIKIIVKWIKEQYSGDSTDFFVRSIRKLENVMTLSE